ncbi:YtrH family sporulation protein [Priestia abyssalis]|uniref:YtrH family sporulation protein n=1 Tax=Priestia abyssalis TaxID=1221450 RepID=UPI0009950444|nr:YtrH family sporulation protein [Priestia abyssalis]
MRETFMSLFILSYFIALGVLLGGTMVGAFGAFLTGKPPLSHMMTLANNLKIWALVAAIGGTFDTFFSLERGVFQGATKDVFKQMLYILAAMGGAQTGAMIIKWLTQEHIGS